jgi:NADH-quinone oxidoreductase subunit G
VLRVLGNELELPNCEYRSPSEISAELERELGAERDLSRDETQYRGGFSPSARSAVAVTGVELDVPIYAIDALVRRAEALQETVLGRQGAA